MGRDLFPTNFGAWKGFFAFLTILSAWGSHSGRRASPHLNSNGCRVLCLGLGVGAKKSSDKQLLGPGHGAGRLGSPPDTLEKLGTATASPLPLSSLWSQSTLTTLGLAIFVRLSLIKSYATTTASHCKYIFVIL